MLPSYPNMYPEILDAITMAYNNYPELQVDCLLYLGELKDNWQRTNELSTRASMLLEKMNYCPRCGESLQTYHYNEVHTELEECPIEEFTELYCPNCDIGGRDI